MKVRELIETNPAIVDVVILVRNYPENGQILDALYIGPSAGVVPPHPFKWEHGRIGKGEATYIRKNINSWDDGKDYLQILPDRIPKRYLDLEVNSWRYSRVCCSPKHHARDDIGYSIQGIEITTFCPEYSNTDMREEKKIEKDKNEQLEGQMFITDWLIEEDE